MRARRSGGTYNKILDADVPVSGTAANWYSSGTISVSLVSGRYYYIGTCWQGSSTYYYDSSTGLVSFGSRINGGHTSYPPAATASNPGSSLAYYQRLTTSGGYSSSGSVTSTLLAPRP